MEFSSFRSGAMGGLEVVSESGTYLQPVMTVRSRLYFQSKIDENFSNKVSFGLKMRIHPDQNSSGSIGFKVASQTSSSTYLTAQINSSKTLSPSGDSSGKELFKAGPELTQDWFELVSVVENRRQVLYFNGYPIAETSIGFSTPIVRVVIEIYNNVSTSYGGFEVDSAYAKAGDPIFHWKAVPAKYSLTEGNVRSFDSVNKAGVHGKLRAQKSTQFEPHTPMTLMYGVNEVDRFLRDSRTNRIITTEILSDVDNIRLGLSRYRIPNEQLRCELLEFL